MRFFGIGVGEGDIMVFAGLVRVEGEIELILPAELKAGFCQSIVAELGSGVAFCLVRGVSS